VAAADTQPDAVPPQAIPLAQAPVNEPFAEAAIPAPDTWRDLPVLITGGLGFIGSTLAIRLAEFGARVTLVDSLIPEYGGNLANIAGYEERLRVNLSDIRDRFSLEALVRGQAVIFNLAGQTSHLDSMRDPRTDLEINCAAQLSLLEICRASNPEVRIVFASTRQLYGRPRYLPVDEAHPTQPVDVNGINKLSAELYHQLYAQVHGLSTAVLRLTNTIGPRMRVKDARQTFVGIWIRRLLEGDPIEVWGGQQLRDFNDVEDVVDALLLAGQCRDLAPTPFNLGHGERITLRELAELLIDLHGSGTLQVTPYPAERQRIDIGDYYSCHQRFTAATGWRPRRSLRQTLERTLAYYGSHLPAYR
jgi:UDP-glucose 4-epimerase